MNVGVKFEGPRWPTEVTGGNELDKRRLQVEEDFPDESDEPEPAPIKVAAATAATSVPRSYDESLRKCGKCIPARTSESRSWRRGLRGMARSPTPPSLPVLSLPPSPPHTTKARIPVSVTDSPVIYFIGIRHVTVHQSLWRTSYPLTREVFNFLLVSVHEHAPSFLIHSESLRDVSSPPSIEWEK